MEGEEAAARLMEAPLSDQDAQELPEEGENGAEGAAAMEELTGSEDTEDGGVPAGLLQPDRDMLCSSSVDGECWGWQGGDSRDRAYPEPNPPGGFRQGRSLVKAAFLHPPAAVGVAVRCLSSQPGLAVPRRAQPAPQEAAPRSPTIILVLQVEQTLFSSPQLPRWTGRGALSFQPLTVSIAEPGAHRSWCAAPEGDGRGRGHLPAKGSLIPQMQLEKSPLPLLVPSKMQQD